MSQAFGKDYERLLEDFLRLGGDLDSCPFDTEEGKYEGPRLEEGEMVD